MMRSRMGISFGFMGFRRVGLRGNTRHSHQTMGLESLRYARRIVLGRRRSFWNTALLYPAIARLDRTGPSVLCRFHGLRFRIDSCSDMVNSLDYFEEGTYGLPFRPTLSNKARRIGQRSALQ